MTPSRLLNAYRLPFNMRTFSPSPGFVVTEVILDHDARMLDWTPPLDVLCKLNITKNL
jgi:hypothetical protein